jgi:hypothetical protein
MAGLIRNRYLIRYDDTREDQRQQYRADATNLLRSFAAQNKIGASGDPTDYVVRDFQPLLDITTPPNLNRWQTAALAAIGTYYTVFQNQATVPIQNNMAVCVYSVSVLDANFPVSRLRIQEGVNGATTYGDFDLQQMENNLTATGYLSQPVLFGPQRIMNITVCSKVATGAIGNVSLGILVVEPFGKNISG